MSAAVQAADGRHHKWGDPVTVTEDTPSGCQQTERTCALCGLVKVTVHPPHGLPWREWRPAGGPQMPFTATPPCLVAKGVAA